MSSELKALSAIVLKSVFSSDDVWSDAVVHVDGLHVSAWDEILQSYNAIQDGNAVDNIVVQGRPGAGKTHLLGQLRRKVVGNGDLFVYFQMNSADQIWQGLMLAYIDSMLRTVANEATQADHLFTILSGKLGDKAGRQIRSILDGTVGDRQVVRNVRQEIGQLFGPQVQAREAADAALALLLSASADYGLQNIGYTYLIASDVTPEDVHDRQSVGLLNPSLEPKKLVRAIDRLVAATGKVTVLAIDQLDGLIAAACHAHDKDGEDAALLDQIATALMDVSELTSRTLVIVSSLVATWKKIESAIPSACQRFPKHPQINLLPSADAAQALVESHLTRGFARAGFTPRYPSWPIRPSAFADATHMTSRQIINLVDAHVTRCRQSRKIAELEIFELESVDGPADGTPSPTPPKQPGPSAPSDRIQKDFNDAYRAADVTAALNEKTVDAALPELLREGLAAWVDETGDRSQFQIDPEFGKTAPLHARLRQTLDAKSEDESHWSFRAIYNAHHGAALTRLRAAMTQSAIDMGAQKRQLAIFRNTDWSVGSKTKEVVRKFEKLGGRCLPIMEDDLRTFAALRDLRAKHGEKLTPWLKHERPASKTQLFKALLSDECSALVDVGPPPHKIHSGTANGGARTKDRVNSLDVVKLPVDQGSGATDTAASLPPPPTTTPHHDAPMIRLGGAIENNANVMLKLEDMRRHMAIFAGSGSGKTVLIRRIVEECALQGVSSIVLDPNNDLARLGTPWPDRPSGWSFGDATKAARYFDETEVVIWTPRRTTGRPLSFRPLGDLKAVCDDADELAIAIDSAVATIFQRAGLPATGGKQEQGRAVLKEALTQFISEGGDGLMPFLEFLADLPFGISRLANGEKLAHDIAQTLIAATVNDPLFGGDGEAVDPSLLLTPSSGKRARVSVISLIGLPNDDQRQSFVNQLQMALFSWVKKNPAGDRPLGGLFVMDEAQTLAPSGSTTPCTESTLALASQARKYGLGLVFATQAPKGLHNRIAGNATTQFYGFLNSPAQIEAARELARAKGSDVPDISRLTTGQFYVASESIPLQKIATPLCLSHHPKSPLGQNEVLELAKAG